MSTTKNPNLQKPSQLELELAKVFNLFENYYGNPLKGYQILTKQLIHNFKPDIEGHTDTLEGFSQDLETNLPFDQNEEKIIKQKLNSNKVVKPETKNPDYQNTKLDVDPDFKPSPQSYNYIIKLARLNTSPIGKRKYYKMRLLSTIEQVKEQFIFRHKDADPFALEHSVKPKYQENKKLGD